MTAHADIPDAVGDRRHLPECDYEQTKDVCYCDILHACEQRVREDDNRALWDQRQYLAGVQAARDAVAGVGVRKDTSHDMRVQALAAIDALRGES